MRTPMQDDRRNSQLNGSRTLTRILQSLQGSITKFSGLMIDDIKHRWSDHQVVFLFLIYLLFCLDTTVRLFYIINKSN